VAASIVVPAIVADAGDHAARRFLEFFAATIRNRNPRAAYLHAVGKFFAWCEHHRIGQLADIEPLHVAAYIEALGGNFEKPTVKQHLAAIRMQWPRMKAHADETLRSHQRRDHAR
jgi:integrase/recombinase XerD